MYSEGLVSLTLALGAVNLAGLIAVVWRVRKNQLFLKKLFPKNGGEFKDKLTEVLSEVSSLAAFKKQNLHCIQRLALKRYNPYHDTGGDQSFSAAFLDGLGDGVVLTSLHSRAGTRVFAKMVKQGRADKIDFSQEESEIVKEAMNPT